ncbi:MAG: FtsH protease activity modulator HflK [Clostridia bacterium]
MKKKAVTGSIVLVVLAVVALLGLMSVYRVGQGEEAVVLTFGRVTAHQGPGLYFRIPLFQQVRSASVTTIYTSEYGFRTTKAGSASTSAVYKDVESEGVMLTNDNNIVMVEAIYQYNIRDVQQYLFDVDDPLGTLQLAFEAVIRRNIQNRPLDDALLNKEEIELQVLPDFQRLIDGYDIGIQVRNVYIQNITVPKNVTAAYEDVNNAKNEKTRKLDDAERYRNGVVPVARSNAYQLLQDAEGYRAEKIAQAKADVAVFEQVYEKYKSSPEITRKRLLIETLEKVLSNAERKLVLESEGVLKTLPVDALLQGGVGDE